MSSRQEEKERRRQEREAVERAHQRSVDRRKRMGIVGGGVLVAAVLVIVALAAFSGSDDGPGSNGGTGVRSSEPPTQGNDKNLDVAAEAAGCKVTTHKSEGRGHTTEAVKYNTNPPTSGSHDPTPSEDGEYDTANPPDIEASVHALEHGRINFQYKAGSPPDRIAQFKGLFEEEVKGTGGYHSLLFQNQTNMTAAVAATAWTRSLTCDEWNDQVFDAMRAFRRQFVDKGPEFIP